jgi:hypothetical protein
MKQRGDGIHHRQSGSKRAQQVAFENPAEQNARTDRRRYSARDERTAPRRALSARRPAIPRSAVGFRADAPSLQPLRFSSNDQSFVYGSPRTFDSPLASAPPALIRCLRVDALPARRVGCFETLRVERFALPPPDAPPPFAPRALFPLPRWPPPRDFCLLVPPPRRFPVVPPRDLEP